MNEQSKTIIAYYANQDGDFIYPLAKYLSETHGINTVLIYPSKSFLPAPGMHNFSLDGFSEVHELDDLIKISSAYDGCSKDIAERATRFEERSGVSIHDCIRADRHSGNGFVSGAEYSKSAFGKNSYASFVEVALRLSDFYEELIDKYNPICVITGFASLQTNLLGSIADAKDIPVRFRNFTRSGKRANWSINKHCEPFGLNEAYAAALSLPIDVDGAAMQPPLRATVTRPALMDDRKTKRFLKKIYLIFRQRVGNIVKNRKSAYGGYYVSDLVHQTYVVWRLRRKYHREFEKEGQAKVEDIRTPYVFFPLSVEPESTLMAESQMCDNQLTLIDWLAKTVPTCWKVVVKEHPGFTAQRPVGFWEQIERYPNVVVINPYHSAIEYVEQAKIVAVINGTAGFQAASYGIPVLTFHPRYTALLLDHVLHANSYESCREKLRELLKIEERVHVDVRIKQARALISAHEENSIALEKDNLLLGLASKGNLPEAFVAEYADLLMSTISIDTQ